MNSHNDIVDFRIKAYYERCSLDADRLRALRTAVSAPKRAPSNNGQAWGSIAQDRNQSHARRFSGRYAHYFTPPRRLSVTAAAALVVVAAVVVIVVMFQLDRSPESVAFLSEQVAAEIALNHGKQLAIEVPADSFGELAAAMPKLGFAPIRAQQLPKSCYALVGARYCSIGGSIAVQVRLIHEGRAYTLYQWREDSAFALMRESSIDVEGVRVVLWREGGLIMGLAGPQL